MQEVYPAAMFPPFVHLHDLSVQYMIAILIQYDDIIAAAIYTFLKNFPKLFTIFLMHMNPTAPFLSIMQKGSNCCCLAKAIRSVNANQRIGNHMLQH